MMNQIHTYSAVEHHAYLEASASRSLPLLGLVLTASISALVYLVILTGWSGGLLSVAAVSALATTGRVLIDAGALKSNINKSPYQWIRFGLESMLVAVSTSALYLVVQVDNALFIAGITAIGAQAIISQPLTPVGLAANDVPSQDRNSDLFRASIYHEVGHLMGYLMVDQSYWEGLELTVDGDGNGLMHLRGGKELIGDHKTVKSLALSALGGAAMEMIVTGTANHGAESDFTRYYQYARDLERLLGNPLFVGDAEESDRYNFLYKGMQYDLGCMIDYLQTNWGIVKHLADKLRITGRLDASQLTDVLNQTDKSGLRAAFDDIYRPI